VRAASELGKPTLEPLVLRGCSLAAYVDDTGHESLKGQPVYGLGGCAVMGCDYERIINQPWRAVRKHVTGSSDGRLHANKFSRKPEDIDVVARFFREQPFWRFAAVFTQETILAEQLTRLGTMKGVLEKRINDIVGKTLCKQVGVVFESSQRTNRLIESAFQSFDFRRGSERVPSECGFMPKSAGEPALEVADFVMHAVGRQMRHCLTKRDTYLPDFCAVFHAVGPDLSDFIEVTGALPLVPITGNPPGPI
jgi:hypothetical protein